MMTDYALLLKQIRGFAEQDPWYVSLMSNVSAILMESLPDLNWAGFYVFRNGMLTVGPFQGRPACIHIEPGRGVCGTALVQDQILRVPDVHQFPGHIACDSASRSEIVLPIHRDGQAAGVLDIDSPVPDRFSDMDEQGLAGIAELLENVLQWDGI